MFPLLSKDANSTWMWTVLSAGSRWNPCFMGILIWESLTCLQPAKRPLCLSKSPFGNQNKNRIDSGSFWRVCFKPFCVSVHPCPRRLFAAWCADAQGQRCTLSHQVLFGFVFFSWSRNFILWWVFRYRFCFSVLVDIEMFPCRMSSLPTKIYSTPFPGCPLLRQWYRGWGAISGYQDDRWRSAHESQTQAHSIMNVTLWPITHRLISPQGIPHSFMQSTRANFYWVVNNLTVRIQRWQDTAPGILPQCIYVYQIITLCTLNIRQFCQLHLDRRDFHILRYEEVNRAYPWFNLNFRRTETACLWPVKDALPICFNY